MRPYIVRQGEHLLGIAARQGFDADEVWEHEDNRELRDTRASGQVLAPGDVLFIPDAEEAVCGLDPETLNRYRAPMPRAALCMQLHEAGEPLANARYRISGLRVPVEGTTDGEGRIEEEVPAHVGELQLELPDRDGEAMVLRLGHYDPPHTEAGLRQRLRGAGALGELDGVEYDLPGMRSRDEELEELAEALRRFQRDRDLEETGEADRATRDALEETSRD